MSPLGVFELLSQADFEVMHIWLSRGYSGFRAILNMGKRATKPLAFLGDFIYFIYSAGNRLRNLANRMGHKSLKEGIVDAARVAGATDWIARRRVVQPAGSRRAAKSSAHAPSHAASNAYDAYAPPALGRVQPGNGMR